MDRLRRDLRTVRRVDARFGAQLSVLAYHRVAMPRRDPWHLAVSPANFSGHLELMQRIGRIVPLDEALARRRTRAVGRQRFAITFDDGYVDNLDAALAVLERHDAPATMFIPTGFVGGGRFWWDRLDALVLDADIGVEELVVAFSAAGVDVPLSEDRAELHAALHERITDLGRVEIERILDHIVAGLGCPEPAIDGRSVTVDELVRLAAHPLVTIGAHTANHRMLTKLPDREAIDEMVTGTRELDGLIGPASRVLAYPHGRVDRRVAGLARHCGFRHALTTDGRNVARFDAALRIPRINPTDLDTADFEHWLRAPT